MATASLNVTRPWLNLANPGASSPGNTAAAAATSAAPDADTPTHAASSAAHSASASTASCHRASDAAPTATRDTAAAPAAATATRDQHEVVLERSVGFSVEDVESCQADVGDFFLAEDDFVARSLVLRRHDGRGAQRCCGCTAQRQRGARGAHQRQCRLLTRSLGSLLCLRHSGGL